MMLVKYSRDPIHNIEKNTISNFYTIFDNKYNLDDISICDDVLDGSHTLSNKNITALLQDVMSHSFDKSEKTKKINEDLIKETKYFVMSEYEKIFNITRTKVLNMMPNNNGVITYTFHEKINAINKNNKKSSNRSKQFSTKNNIMFDVDEYYDDCDDYYYDDNDYFE